MIKEGYDIIHRSAKSQELSPGSRPVFAAFDAYAQVSHERSKMNARLGLLLLLMTLACGTAPARAHPHVWVAVRSEVVFASDGKIAGIRQAFEFDELYSAFVVQGLGKDNKPPTREELEPKAKEIVENLPEFEFFTFARQNNAKLKFIEPKDVTLEANDKKIVTLRFFLPLDTPVAARKPFSFQVYDPTYFVAFGLEKQTPVTLVQAPAGCSLSFVDPRPLVAAETQRLSEAFFQNFSPGSDYGVKLATRAIVACP